MTHAMHGGCHAVREINRLDGILALLRDHLQQPGATVYDATVARMYREYYCTGRRPIDAAAVARWADRHREEEI